MMIWSWIATRIITPFLPWIIGALLAAGTVGSIAAYFKGRADVMAACREADLKAELATLKRDMAAWRAADEIENILQRDLDARRRELEQRVSEYETELAKRPDSRCIIGPDDVNRLRFGGNR